MYSNSNQFFRFSHFESVIATSSSITLLWHSSPHSLFIMNSILKSVMMRFPLSQFAGSLYYRRKHKWNILDSWLMDCNYHPSFLMLHYPKTIHIHKHDSKLSHHKTNITQTTQQHNAPAWDKCFFSEWQLQWLETQKMTVHKHGYVVTEWNRLTESTHCQYEFHSMISA